MLDDLAGNALDRDFWRGTSLRTFDAVLRYRVKRKSDRARLVRQHVIQSAAGPLLVSAALRAIIEHEAPGDAEFIRAEVDDGDAISTNFHAINLL